MRDLALTRVRFLLCLVFLLGEVVTATPPGLELSQEQPDAPFYLENDLVRIALRRDRPSVIFYQYKPGQAVVDGDVTSSTPDVTVLQDAQGVFRTLTRISYSPTISSDAVTYHSTVNYAGNAAVEFDLVYSLNGRGLTIELKRVVEHESFDLIHVRLPPLISVGTGRPVAKLVLPADSGRLIDVKTASQRTYEYEIDWLNPILAAMVYNDQVVGIVDTTSLENHAVATTFELEGRSYAALSMNLIHRLKEYNLEEFGQIIPVTDPDYLLKVQDSCTVTVSLTDDYDGDGGISWVDGAKLIRDCIDARPHPYYADKLFVRAILDRPYSQRFLPFGEVLERIRELALQTHSPAYVLYLLGWQYEGHDSGYPSVDKVNERLGGYDELVRLIEEARQYNVTVSFHDNYDDSYMPHPGWDPDVICRDSRGDLMTGGFWDGGMSYLICPDKYVRKSALERVRDTVRRYPVSDTYFIDVLAGGYNGGRKYDFDPENPAGAEKNFKAKLEIIQEFNRHGMDVTTEDFTGFFVGHVGSFGYIIDNDSVYFRNETRIPFIPFIYHGKTSYGMKNVGGDDGLRRLIYGERAGHFTSVGSVFTPDELILDALPKQKLYGKAMKSYLREGEIERVVYEDGSRVEVNHETLGYTVVVDGRPIARNGTSFVPVAGDVYLACSREGGSLSYPAPTGWADAGRVRAVRRHGDGTSEDVACRLSEGNITLDTQARVPYIITYE